MTSPTNSGLTPVVLAKASKFITVLTLCLVLGLHWTILQTVAWTGMFVSFSKTAPVTEALAKTFDGQHPCQLCKFVTSGKQAEKKSEAQAPVTKIDFLLAAAPADLFPPVLAPLPSFADAQPDSARPAPPRQRPRLS